MTTNAKPISIITLKKLLKQELFLKGSEIKSIRESKIDISNAFCRIQNQEVWLHNAHICPI